MKKHVTGNRFRFMCFLAVLLLGSLAVLHTVSGSSQCQVDVEITGILVDERGDPVEGEELLFSFYVNPEKRDVVVPVDTGEGGFWKLQASIPQSIYDNTGFRCVEIQGRVILGDPGDEVQYQPGAPHSMTTESDYESWAGEGDYPGGEVRLFHSIRVQDEAGENDGFDDFSIQLGSREAPCVLQIGGVSKGGTHIQVSHLDGDNKKELKPSESYTYRESDPPSHSIKLEPIGDMAPLKVEISGTTLAEAARDEPVGEIEIKNLVVNHSQSDSLELTVYYRMDRDGDGVPDYLVREQFVTDDGRPVPGRQEESGLYAHRDVYSGSAPAIKNYRYTGYRQLNGPLIPGETPVETVTSDLLYQFVYDKEGGSGGGDSGKENPQPPEEGGKGEPPPGETKPPEGTGGPEPPELPDPEPGSETAPDEKEELPEQKQEGVRQEGGGRNPVAVKEPAAAKEEREQLRNITFIKLSYRKEAKPGEEVTYGFQGFENAFSYPLTEFTIVDQPDPGLDLVAINLPVFQQGEGQFYEITYTTNLRQERTLKKEIPADTPVLVKPPALEDGEHITAVTMLFGEVPAGFGEDDEIQITFRVWDNPPEDSLHNLGYLYYEELGEKVSVASGESSALVDVSGGMGGSKPPEQLQNTGQERADFIHGGRKSLFRITILALLIFAAVAAASAVQRKKEKT